ncbi:mitochondrial import receptor subunit TOM6-like protein [Platysternon megacephalum]|uniref:Mitochondrial import receptor subunit TOM6-like protein n=1 Tax=Platysternon megacephalum TaxID=55544 RepID=A0A4D9E9V6_9SAUR|nr:mitochondrial import receptor subunit TOM6-like protein [Platysternon megacephalum]
MCLSRKHSTQALYNPCACHVPQATLPNKTGSALPVLVPAPCYRMHSNANIYFHHSCGRDSHNAVGHACVLGQGDYQINFDSAKCSQSSLPCPTVSTTLLLVEVGSSKSKGAITKSSHICPIWAQLCPASRGADKIVNRQKAPPPH